MGRLSNLLDYDAFLVRTEAVDVEQAIRSMIASLADRTPLDAALAESVASAILARERLGSTGLGEGVAVPHAYVEGLESTFLIIATLRTPIDFGAHDGLPVDVIFLLIGAPRDKAKHLGLIARIARLLHHPTFPTQLRAATTPEEGLAAVEGVESRHP